MGQTFCKETNRNISFGGYAIVYILKLPASMLSHNQSGDHISESTIWARDGFANRNVMSLFCNRDKWSYVAEFTVMYKANCIDHEISVSTI